MKGMKTKITKGLTALAACLTMGTAWAQTDSIAQPCTLAQLIATGLQNNYGLRIVRNAEERTDNEATRANAGYLPTVNLQAGYDAALNSSEAHQRATGATQRERNAVTHGVQAAVNAEWTVFDGFKIQTNYRRLQELRLQGQVQTRIALEDYVAGLTSEYYNFIQQRIRMRNLRQAVNLSKERLRIVSERYALGSASRLDLQQARVDFNADSARSLKQLELFATSRIKLYQLMAVNDITSRLLVPDTAIVVDDALVYDSLLSSTLRANAQILHAARQRNLAQLDYQRVVSRDYPYVKLAASYAVAHDMYSAGNNTSRTQWGGDIGVKVGFNLFDGKRSMERRNARLSIDDAELAEQELEQNLRADLADLWQAYRNNMRLLLLERENLITAKENHYIASERYLLGDLSGIEMREAQQSLLDAEERILVAEYNTKLCEISLRQISGNVMHYMAEAL